MTKTLVAPVDPAKKTSFLDDKARVLAEGGDKKKRFTFEEACAVVAKRRVFGAMVIVQIIVPEEEVTTTGIVKINVQQRNLMGRVVKAGPGEWLSNGVFVPMEQKVGEEVLVTKHGGTTIELDGIELKLMHTKQCYLGEEPIE
jgi:chaperonin GroES